MSVAKKFESAGQFVEELGRELQWALPDDFTVMIDRHNSPGNFNRQSWKVSIWKNRGGGTGTWSDARVRSQVVVSFHDGSLWESFARKTVEAYGMAWDGCNGMPQVEGRPSAVFKKIVSHARSLARQN